MELAELAAFEAALCTLRWGAPITPTYTPLASPRPISAAVAVADSHPSAAVDGADSHPLPAPDPLGGTEVPATAMGLALPPPSRARLSSTPLRTARAAAATGAAAAESGGAAAEASCSAGEAAASEEEAAVAATAAAARRAARSAARRSAARNRARLDGASGSADMVAAVAAEVAKHGAPPPVTVGVGLAAAVGASAAASAAVAAAFLQPVAWPSSRAAPSPRPAPHDNAPWVIGTRRAAAHQPDGALWRDFGVAGSRPTTANPAISRDAAESALIAACSPRGDAAPERAIRPAAAAAAAGRPLTAMLAPPQRRGFDAASARGGFRGGAAARPDPSSELVARLRGPPSPPPPRDVLADLLASRVKPAQVPLHMHYLCAARTQHKASSTRAACLLRARCVCTKQRAMQRMHVRKTTRSLRDLLTADCTARTKPTEEY